jgi:hypothetical protein
MVMVLSYGMHVSMYMIFFLFYVMYELWLWLFSFLCHIFHLETKKVCVVFIFCMACFILCLCFFISF